MLDNPVPSPHSPPASQAVRAPEAIQPPSANGVAAKPHAEDHSLGHTFGQTLRYYALYLGLLAGLWSVAFAGLLFTGFTLPEAIGFATVAALVGSFFVRSLVPQLAEKA